jgi:hypothetical protein
MSPRTLIKERYELPAFSTLAWFGASDLGQLSILCFRLSAVVGTDQERLDALLASDPHLRRSPYNRLKQVPKRPTLTHLQIGSTISPGCCPWRSGPAP